MPKPSEGVSILGDMVAETLAAVGEKAPKATLTALPGEAGALDPLPQTPAPFPNDVPTEVVLAKARELTRIIDHLIESRDALLKLVDAKEPASPVADQKAAERAADEKASKREKVAAAHADVYSPERFRVLQEEAQAATFTAQPEARTTVHTVATSGWACTEHPDTAPIPDRSPRGREFMRCGHVGCKQFSR